MRLERSKPLSSLPKIIYIYIYIYISRIYNTASSNSGAPVHEASKGLPKVGSALHLLSKLPSSASWPPWCTFWSKSRPKRHKKWVPKERSEGLQIRFQENTGKCEFDTLFITFRPRRASLKSLILDEFWGRKVRSKRRSRKRPLQNTSLEAQMVALGPQG